MNSEDLIIPIVGVLMVIVLTLGLLFGSYNADQARVEKTKTYTEVCKLATDVTACLTAIRDK